METKSQKIKKLNKLQAQRDASSDTFKIVKLASKIKKLKKEIEECK
ncbi:MAG: hypothetical protein AABY22_33220 [Nanoarchaeota archaeon]